MGDGEYRKRIKLYFKTGTTYRFHLSPTVMAELELSDDFLAPLDNILDFVVTRHGVTYLHLKHDSEDIPATLWSPTLSEAEASHRLANESFVLPPLPARRVRRGRAVAEPDADGAPPDAEPDADGAPPATDGRTYVLVSASGDVNSLTYVNHSMRMPMLPLSRIENVDDTPLLARLESLSVSGSAFHTEARGLFELSLRCRNSEQPLVATIKELGGIGYEILGERVSSPRLFKSADTKSEVLNLLRDMSKVVALQVELDRPTGAFDPPSSQNDSTFLSKMVRARRIELAGVRDGIGLGWSVRGLLVWLAADGARSLSACSSTSTRR